MKIIFAQGNPEQAYARTRHNVGFLLIDEFAAAHNASFTRIPKFHASIADVTIEGEKVLLVKPTTFYNETGRAARLLIDFYKLNPETDFLVIYDDLALPLGTLRTRRSGSSAGNNGIKSLNTHIGSLYARVRVGTYNNLRDQMHNVDFVLGHFNKDEKLVLIHIYPHVVHFIDGFIKNNFETTKVSLAAE